MNNPSLDNLSSTNTTTIIAEQINSSAEVKFETIFFVVVRTDRKTD